MEHNITDEQRKEAQERIERVKKYIEENDVTLIPVPQLDLVGMSSQDGSPVYGVRASVRIVDVRYAPKGDNKAEGGSEGLTPSPFGV